MSFMETVNHSLFFLSAIKHNPEKLGLNPKFIVLHVSTQTVKASSVPIFLLLAAQRCGMELSWLCSAKNLGLQWLTLSVQCFFKVPVMLSAGEKAIAEIMRVAQQ